MKYNPNGLDIFTLTPNREDVKNEDLIDVPIEMIVATLLAIIGILVNVRYIFILNIISILISIITNKNKSEHRMLCGWLITANIIIIIFHLLAFISCVK